jgi:hypothetical protein
MAHGFLRSRFSRVPMALETTMRQLNDPVVLESYTVEARRVSLARRLVMLYHRCLDNNSDNAYSGMFT